MSMIEKGSRAVHVLVWGQLEYFFIILGEQKRKVKIFQELEGIATTLVFVEMYHHRCHVGITDVTSWIESS